MINMMINAIFFDLDGVLTTDKTGSITSSKFYAQKIGVDFLEVFERKRIFDVQTDLGTISSKKLWKKICEECGGSFDERWLTEAHLSTPIDKKMIDYAKKLQKKFIVGIITDNSVERVRNLMNMHNWSKVFEPVIVSAEVGYTKKDKRIFEIAFKQAGVQANECIFIDNKQSNVDMADKAGLHGIFFDDVKRDYKELFAKISKLTNHSDYSATSL